MVHDLGSKLGPATTRRPEIPDLLARPAQHPHRVEVVRVVGLVLKGQRLTDLASRDDRLTA
jgi:hypothetical protein